MSVELEHLFRIPLELAYNMWVKKKLLTPQPQREIPNAILKFTAFIINLNLFFYELRYQFNQDLYNHKKFK